MAAAGLGRGLAVLCLLAWAAPAAGDRVYIHPFHLLTYDQRACDRLENRSADAPPDPTFSPIPIQGGAKAAPVDEEALRDELAAAAQTLGAADRGRAAGVGLLLNFLGLRMYRALRAARGAARGAALLSPAALFGTLASFYLGAEGPTADRLQAFLGVPGQGPSCTSRLDGHKVLSALRATQALLVSGRGAPLLSTAVGLFAAPGLRLKQPFVRALAPFAPVALPRALDLAEPEVAAARIGRFVRAVTGWPVSAPAAASAGGTLLFHTYVRFRGKMKGFSLLAEPQEFWVDNATSVSVPMLVGTGAFQHWDDAKNNLSVTRVPLGGNAWLLLIQPQSGSDLDEVESLAFQYDFLARMKSLPVRALRLTMPQLLLEASHDLRDLLAQAKLPGLLGAEARLGKMSDAGLRVGQVLNCLLFELSAEDGKPAAPTPQPARPAPLEVTLDRPFLVAVLEQASGAIHFLGRVARP
ncbi:angiotensinogen [Dasypus novemcinctus]|uniref:angiotensinogen n=1 Tax=Dasypus novemcinctus TaxID=9361 RepID=UPI00265FD111|nr:angiotensinogen [Dasypus novemcinctus]